MELYPSGPGALSSLIPESRTSVPYNLVTDLSGLGTEIQEYNIPELEKSLEVGSQDLNATPAKETTSGFQRAGAHSRTSSVTSSRRSPRSSRRAPALSAVLSQRSHQLFDLFGQGNLVLTVLEQRRTAIRQLLTATTTFSQQITSILSVNRSQLTTLLQSLQRVSAILAKDSNDFGQAIPVLAAFSRYAANIDRVGSVRRRVGADTLLIPDNLIDQCAPAARLRSRAPNRPGGMPTMRSVPRTRRGSWQPSAVVDRRDHRGASSPLPRAARPR